MAKKTLIVIDMQYDFVYGALGTAEAQAIIPNVKAKIEEYRKNGNQVIFTRDTHDEEYLKTNEGKNLPVEHCIRGTKGWEVIDGLELKDSVCIDKENRFGWPHWDRFELEEAELIGVCTDICVVSNALIIKALFPEIVVSVDSACCAGVTPRSHKAALETMKMCHVQVF